MSCPSKQNSFFEIYTKTDELEKKEDSDGIETVSVNTVVVDTTIITSIDNIETSQDENKQDTEYDSDAKTNILWFFNEDTIWYLIVGIFGAFIMVTIGCCILCCRYRILLKKTKSSPESKIGEAYSNNKNEYKYHYNKNNEIGYDYKHKKSPENAEDDICLVPSQFDIVSNNDTQSPTSTVTSPQLTAKVSINSVSDMSSVININNNDNNDQRRSIKIVKPQYYQNNNDNMNVQREYIRKSNNSLYSQTPTNEHYYLEEDENNKSSSNESMYDPNLSVERTRTGTDGGDSTI